MPASLDHVRQKLGWAAKHLDTLKVEIARYYSTKPGELVTEDDFDTNTQWLTFKRKPVPDPILFTAGDVIQNIRAIVPKDSMKLSGEGRAVHSLAYPVERPLQRLSGCSRTTRGRRRISFGFSMICATSTSTVGF
jgi:hypothetical protein